MKNTDDNEKKEILVRVLAYLIPYKVQFLQAGLILIISTVIGLLQPLVIQWLTDDGMLQQNIRTILQAAVILALLVILHAENICCAARRKRNHRLRKLVKR